MAVGEKTYLVYIDCPAYPQRGCYVEAIPYGKDETFDTVKDALPPSVLEKLEVTAPDIRTAREVGLWNILAKLMLPKKTETGGA